LPWLLVALPLLAVHASYLLSANGGYVPWCVPYLEGCTSISRAARNGPANLLFKLLMLPYAALLVLFWQQTGAWLRTLRPDAGRRSKGVRLLGIVAAVFLSIYVVCLGVDGELYQWMRRYGITVFFGFSVLAQMLSVALLAPLLHDRPRLRRAMLAFAASLLGLGLLSLPLQHFAADGEAATNALEWTYAALMTFFYALIGAAVPVNGSNIPTR
jgi:hypothetical protein